MKRVKYSLYVAVVIASLSMIAFFACGENTIVPPDADVDEDTGSESDGGSLADGGGKPDGSVAKDGGAVTDGGSNKDGGGVTDGGVVEDGGGKSDGGTQQNLDKFSFFVTSLKAIRELSKNQNGFGGDLRYGFTGAGAGLKGADKICSEIAEMSMEGSSVKQWRAFLSVTADENGKQVNARDRIGNGPWYDRLGRLLAPDLTSLLNTRPLNGNSAIKNDFPNEDGVPNHQPDPTQPEVDNHDMITGSNTEGKLYGSSGTCKDWTSNLGTSDEGQPRVGHSWPRSGGPAAGGGMGDMSDWMSALNESGCKPGVNLVETGAPDPKAKTIGSGGGYGGFYCFALFP